MNLTIIALFAVLPLSACDLRAKAKASYREESPPDRKVQVSSDIELYGVAFEDHQFVVGVSWMDRTSPSVIHHPGCPCLKDK